MIIDSHCHLNYDPMFNNLDEVVNNAKTAGIKYLLTISTKDNEFKNILNIIKNYKFVYGTYGIHPHEAKNHRNVDSKKILINLKKNKKIIGIGETGLDFYYNHSDKNNQIELFNQHIVASRRSNLPLIIHTRSAENETYQILKKATDKEPFKFLIHCFTGSKEFAFKLLDLGAYISASGVVTFKKSKDLAETFKSIPNDRILVETDSPYLAPEPHRGKSNEPALIVHTLKFLAGLKNNDLKEMSNITSDNFFKLFGKLN